MATDNIKKGKKTNAFLPFIAETMAAQSSSSSPANKVLSIDDLLTGILRRLPVRSLLCFKSVSKHWYFLITSPSFKLLRSRNPDPPSGLFVPIRTNKPYLEYEFVSFDIDNSVKSPFTTLNFDTNATRIDIEHSSNGLMLCSSHSSAINEVARVVLPNHYYVYNPTINQFITLPRVENYNNLGRSGMTIAFDPSISSDYRLVYVCGLGNVNITGEGETNYQIEVFSSTTRTWKTSCQFSFDSRIDLDFKRGVYWNNAIHWLQIGGYILYFDLDEEIIHKKQTPLKLLGLDADSNRIFESRDRLLLVELELVSLNSKFKIHELKRDYSEWSVKYLVDIEEVGGLFPEIMNPRLATKFQFDIQSLVLGEKEGDCFLVLEIIGKALRYNLVTKTFHKLNDFPASRFPKYYRLFTGMPYVFPFVESLYSL